MVYMFQRTLQFQCVNLDVLFLSVAAIWIEEDDADGQLYYYSAKDNTGSGTQINFGEALADCEGIDYDPVDDKVRLLPHQVKKYF